MPYWDPPIDDPKPWSARVRVVPMRTYSGRVVYDRKEHYFTAADLARITSKVKIDPEAEDRNFSLLETIVRFIWTLIFQIVPMPHILEGLPAIFTEFYMNWMHDSRTRMPVLDAFNIHIRIFIRKLIALVWGNISNFIDEEAPSGSSETPAG